MVYVFLAHGFEEVEALTPVDYLRRSGLEVVCVGVGSKLIQGAHKIVVEADDELSSCEVNLAGNMIILPGGLQGTENLKSNEKVCNILKKASEVGSLAAICAAPTILGSLNLLKGKEACCYPGFEKLLVGAKVVDCDVVVSGNIITSKGAGTAQQFSFEIVKFLLGHEASNKLKTDVQWI